MTVTFHCSACGFEFQVNEDLANQNVFCTQCGASCHKPDTNEVDDVEVFEEVEVVDDQEVFENVEVIETQDFDNVDLASVDLGSFPDALPEIASVPTPVAPAQPVSQPTKPTKVETPSSTPAPKSPDKKSLASALASVDQKVLTAAFAGIAGLMILVIVAIGVWWWIGSGSSDTADSVNATSVSTAVTSVGAYPAGKPQAKEFYPWDIGASKDTKGSLETETSTADSSGTSDATTDSVASENRKKATANENTLACMRDAIMWVAFHRDRQIYRTSGFLFDGSGKQGYGMESYVVAALPDGLGELVRHNVICSQATKPPESKSGRRPFFRGNIVGVNQEAGLMVIKVSDRSLPHTLISDNVVEVTQSEAVNAKGIMLAIDVGKHDTLDSPKDLPLDDIKVQVQPVNDTPSSVKPGFVVVQDSVPSHAAGTPLITDDGKFVGMITTQKDENGVRVASMLDIKRALSPFVADLKTQVLARDGDSVDVFSSLAISGSSSVKAKVHLVRADQATIKRSEDGLFEPLSESPLQTFDMKNYRYGRMQGFASVVSTTQTLDKVYLQYELSIGDQSGFGTPTRIQLSRQFELRSHESELSDDSKPPKGILTVLPSMMSSFHDDPVSGDVACVSLDGQSVYLLKADQVGNPVSSLPELKFENAVSDCVFKRYKDKRYLLVVRSETRIVDVIEVDSWKKIKSILASHAPASKTTRPSSPVVMRLAASQNPDDPLAYVCDGNLHGIDLETMSFLGFLFQSVGSVSVSLDGQWILGKRDLRTGRYFSGALKVTRQPDQKLPALEFFAAGNSMSNGAVHDPLGNVTYLAFETRTLNMQPIETYAKNYTARLGAVLGKRPVGAFITREHTNMKYDLTLNFPSILDRQAAAPPVVLPDELVKEAAVAMWQVSDKPLFAKQIQEGPSDPWWWYDASHDRIVIANLSQIASVPLSGLDLPEEPPLTLNQVFANLSVGRPAEINLEPSQKNSTIEILDYPSGLEPNEGTIRWTPKNDDLGDHRILMRLTKDSHQRELGFGLRVSRPSVKSPIVIQGMALDPQERFAVVWSGLSSAELEQISRNRLAPADARTEICLIPLRAASKPIRFAINSAIHKCVLAGIQLVVQPVDNENHRIEIYDLRTRKRQKTLLPTSAISEVAVDGEQLVLDTQSGRETYSLSTFRKMRSKSGKTARQTRTSSGKQIQFLDGYLSDHTLRDSKNDSVKLILNPPRCQYLFRYDQSAANGSFLRQIEVNSSRNLHNSYAHRGTIQYPDVISMDTKVVGSLRYEPTSDQSASSQRNTGFTTRVLRLLLKGKDGQVISDEPVTHDYVFGMGHGYRPLLVPVNNRWYVACNRQIFRLTTPGEQAGDKVDNEEPVKFHFVPRQSEFTIGSRPAKLTHQVRGGEQPIEYNLIPPQTGIDVDAATGEVMIDGTLMVAEAIKKLKSQPRREGDRTAYMNRMRTYADEQRTMLRSQMGIRVRGMPFALPIHLKAIDGSGKIAQIQYFVLVDVPMNAIESALE